MNIKKIKTHLSPNVKIVLGFVCIILVGAFLLTLPISNRSGNWLQYIDALFTSTSAVCVTGLIVVDTALNFTIFGQIVILMLIQIGGLGLVALTSFVLMILGKKINFTSRITIKESLNKDNIQGVVKFIKNIIIITFTIELLGAICLLYSCIKITNSIPHGIFNAIFLSISAFCNAGFDVFNVVGMEFASLTPFASEIMLLLPIMLLIILGGIGFIVILNIKNIKKLNQHIKIVLIITSLLIFCSSVIFLIFEWNNPLTLGNLSIGGKIVNALFQSVTPRTAGFCALNQADLTIESRILTMFLMFIGGSPNSTAGGIKTTTFFIILLFIFKQPDNNGDMIFNKQRISNKIILKTLKIVSYAICFLIICIISIRIFEGDKVSFEAIVFECISALSTVGLSYGITPILFASSKTVLVLLMFAGRVGLTTIGLALIPKNNNNEINIIYPNTDIIIG